LDSLGVEVLERVKAHQEALGMKVVAYRLTAQMGSGISTSWASFKPTTPRLRLSSAIAGIGIGTTFALSMASGSTGPSRHPSGAS
jgi:hypothetical protein